MASAEQTYLFTHTILRDAAYQLQMPSERARLHSLALEIVEAFVASREAAAQDAFSGELAEHARLARADAGKRKSKKHLTGLLDKELQYLQRAANWAALRHEVDAALALYERIAAHEAIDEAQRLEAVLAGGNLAMETARLAYARDKLSRLNSEWPKNGDPRIRLRVLGTLAHTEAQMADFDGAQKHYSLGFEHAARHDLHRETLKLRVKYGMMFNAMGKPERAPQELQPTLAAAQKYGDRSEEATCFRGLGVAALHQHQYDVAQDHLDEAIEMQREDGDLRQMARTLIPRGVVMESLGNLQAAQALCHQSLELSRRTGDRGCEAIALQNLSRQLMKSGQVEEALQQIERALTMFQESGARFDEATACITLGRVHSTRGDVERAADAYRRGARLARHANAKRVEGNALSSLGELMFNAARLNESEQSYRQALEICVEAGNFEGAANVCMSLAGVCAKDGRRAEDKGLRKRALDLAEKSGKAALIEEIRKQAASSQAAM